MRNTTPFTPHWIHALRLTPLLCCILIAAGCRTKPTTAAKEPHFEEPPITQPAPGTNTLTPADTSRATAEELPAATIPVTPRTGDEIVVAGQFIHTGTRIVLWTDTNGYNAYGLNNHFKPVDSASQETNSPPASSTRRRYAQRDRALTSEQLAYVRTNGWDMPTVQSCIDQFVLHYDVAGTSRQCFYILHDRRFLSVHFMLDLDGTIYQTLDVKERASHATIANDRSIGIEIANIGAYPPSNTETLDRWYDHDTNGQTQLVLPERFGDGGLLTTNFIARPARMDAITNVVQGHTLVQYDFTPEQYAALSHLTAALCGALPKIKCDAPRETDGSVRNEKLPDEELQAYHGVLGHFHIQTNKTDPGPAFDWEKLLGEAKRLMNESKPASEKSP